ncbi:hypothetical protein ABCS02_25265 [Microbacterium sp. X-17]|uniref:hypothetical protein n=1 Tax=Microbacterium sp. X-17 TaxID=3144404 RepID=UPI0031F4CACB
MNTRPRLVRSVSFWALLVVSLASLGYGLWIVLDKIGVMTSTLQDQSATGVEVYAGQSWIVFGAAFVGAGVIGLIVTLALLALRSLLPAPEVAVVETIDWTTEDADVETSATDPAPTAAAEPAVVTEAEPASPASSTDEPPATPAR